jgi:hypothetical protein
MHLHEIVKIDAGAFIGLGCGCSKLFLGYAGNRPGEWRDLNRARGHISAVWVRNTSELKDMSYGIWALP